MQLHEALATIAERFGLDADELVKFTAEDTIGGYHENPTLQKWDMGSVWEVEAQVLYALIRATKPKLIVELGSYFGCSTEHILAALHENGSGQLVSIDQTVRYKVPAKYAGYIEQIEAEALGWLRDEMPNRRVDFMFEDLIHTPDAVATIWEGFERKAKKGAMIVSHDATHYIIGEGVRAGIERVTKDALYLDVSPGNCGLAVWQKQ